MTTSKYKAFLSYSHRDKSWADWLHRRLETYKFPKNITESTLPSLRPIFRDREELPVSSNLSGVVQTPYLNLNVSLLFVLKTLPNQNGSIKKYSYFES